MNCHVAVRCALAVVIAEIAVAAGAEPGGNSATADPEFYKLALTPPMGWNSFDCYGYAVTEQQVKDNADYMAANLKKHGWEYVVVDFIWAIPLVGPRNVPDQDKNFAPRLVMDEFGRLLPETGRFPSAAGGQGFKQLADYVHGKGLKFGIHLMRGIPRQAVAANTPISGYDGKAADAADTNSACPWLNHMWGLNMKNPAGQAYLNSLFKLYAGWGLDFVKVDDLSEPYHQAEVEGYRRAIDQCGRPMVFSTSPGATTIAAAEHVKRNANMWRLLGDVWDRWWQVKGAFAAGELWSRHYGPGHWPDFDMLPIGKLSKYGPAGPERYSELTKDEIYTLMSFWLITRSPLMVGGNLPENDELTTAVMTNDETLGILKQSTNNRQLYRKGDLIAWVADVHGSHDKYLGLFNALDPEMDEKDALFKSELITRQTPGQAVDIDVDITGVKALALQVSDGGDGTKCDHADWAEPRLIGPAGEKKLTELKWRTATCGWANVRHNKSAGGGALIIGGKKAAYGIGTHSASLIEYDLPEGYTRFKVRAGLDKTGVEATKPGATVKFSVFKQDRNNKSVAGKEIKVSFKDLGLEGECGLRDLWEKKDLGRFKDEFSVILPWHGAGLYRITPARTGL